MKKSVYNQALDNTYKLMGKFSFKEKNKPTFNREIIHHLLINGILDFQNVLKELNEKISNITDELEALTWLKIDTSDQSNLMLVHKIIALSKDLHHSLIRQYNNMNTINCEKIVKEEIKNFKNSIEDLKETTKDVENVFFYLLTAPDFKETSKKLSLV